MRALVVEDDRSAAETIGRVLRADGWTVEHATDGDTGLWRACEGEFDVIVLDIMLPKLNGYKVLRELRRREVWTPVMMLTAKDGEWDQAEALDSGADDYLIKPFSAVVLGARLRALLRRQAVERPAVLHAGTLELDPSDHRVSRAGTDIPLTPREYAVLEYLMRNKGIAVSKATILSALWDENYSGDENIVEVYIGYLRKRVDQPFGVRSIKTVRGAGYMLDDAGQ